MKDAALPCYRYVELARLSPSPAAMNIGLQSATLYVELTAARAPARGPQRI
ncbi:MAG: hypothetical protein JNL83_11195 [Myxococcales bacterium]|nr:hypothetical protein [Myxococcales bacterium]